MRLMKAERYQSWFAAITLLGFLLLGAGLGGYFYFEKKLLGDSNGRTPRPAAARIANPGNVLDPTVAASAIAGLAKTEAVEKKGVILEPDRSASAHELPTVQTILHKYAGKKITLNAVAGNEAAFNLAETIRQIFSEAGWRVNGVHRVIYMQPPEGLCLLTATVPTPAEATAACDALAASGFKVSQQSDPNLKDEMVLVLGISKPDAKP